jgi:acyl carrier protein
MTTTTLPDSTLERIVRPHLKSLHSSAPLNSETCLIQAGLDDVSSVDLLVQLEEELGMRIPDSALDADSLATLSGLRRLLGRVEAGS